MSGPVQTTAVAERGDEGAGIGAFSRRPVTRGRASSLVEIRCRGPEKVYPTKAREARLRSCSSSSFLRKRT